jgi:hypothetical protein
MRKFLIPLAAAASTVALAAPAAAQWYPQPQPQPYGYSYQYPQPQQYGYGYQQPYQNPYQNQYQQPYGYQSPYQQPYGYNYGYRSPYQQPYGQSYGYASYTQVRATKVRIDRIQSDLRRLAQYRMISRNEYYNRINDSREIERRFYRNTRDGMGLSARELLDVQHRVAHLEQRIARDIRDGRQWGFRW